MYKKTITYTNYNGVEVTEDFYFNLSKAELMKMEITKAGGMTAYLNKIVAAMDQEAIAKEFEKILKMSYGVKSDDGRRFIKNEEVWNEFCQTEAYSDFFMSLITDDNAASEFINAIVPKNVGDAVKPETTKLVEMNKSE